MLVAPEKANLPLDYRKALNAEAKASIGKRAVDLLVPGSTIFVDASTTAANMIDAMSPDLGITVLTNSLKGLRRRESPAPSPIQIYNPSISWVTHKNRAVSSASAAKIIKKP